MVLDAIVEDAEMIWLGTADDKANHLTALTSITPEDLPHVSIRNGERRIVRSFPDRLPIGIHLAYMILAGVLERATGADGKDCDRQRANGRQATASHSLENDLSPLGQQEGGAEEGDARPRPRRGWPPCRTDLQLLSIRSPDTGRSVTRRSTP